jgi:cation diffusion facilitator family transporter
MSEEHSHHYLGHRHERNEKRTRWVVVLTAVTMVVEIAVGMMSGSMALLADGWHMATHTLALGVSALAYWLARRWAHDQRYSFGTGKVGELAGFASALALAIVAIGIAVESAGRLFDPRSINYGEAIVVAVLGLVVNLVSAALLHDGHGHGHDHVHGDGHEYHADTNLRSAYMHVLADALTSVLAIVALAAGMLYGARWLDPAVGLIGAAVILRWSWTLIRDTSSVLLDRVPDDALAKTIRSAVESEGDARVTDLHLWQVGPGRFAAIVAIAAKNPADPALYKARIGCDPRIVHITVEVARA